MKKYGQIKQNIIDYLTENYSKGQFKEAFNNAVVPLLETKRFKKIYHLYSQIENAAFNGDRGMAELFLTEVLSEITKAGHGLQLNLPKVIAERESSPNPIYEAIDTLIYKNTIADIQQRVEAKHYLIEYLCRTEEQVEATEPVNEQVLMTLLANNYNSMFGDVQAEDRLMIERYLNMPEEQVKQELNETKQLVTTALQTMMNQSEESTVKKKITETLEEIGRMDVSRHSLYKLTELKNELNQDF